MSQHNRLLLRFIGPPEILLGEIPAKGFDSDKVRALLAYLAIESDRPQRRERLAGLLCGLITRNSQRAPIYDERLRTYGK